MAQTIQLKRSANSTLTSGNGIPEVGDLALGEIAINTHHGKMYIKKNDGSDAIVEVTQAGNVDDYEEGTWTPTLGSSTYNTGIGYTTQVGSYTKIGNQVTANFHLLLSVDGTVYGNMYIGGLPFAANSTPSKYVATLACGDCQITSDTQAVGLISGGTVLMYLYKQNPSADLAAISQSGSNVFTDDGEVYGSITYFTDS